MPAQTLDGRLLCASQSTYAITEDGILDLDESDTYYAGAGFTKPPATFVGGDALIDGCLVGTIPDGVVLAFRGTLPLDSHQIPNLLDWLNNFNADPRPAPGYIGFVHSGFFGAVEALLDRAVAEVQKQQVGTAPVLVTGHSKGGAMAALAAWHLQTALGVRTKVISFAGAKAGNAIFRDAYNAQIDHTRYEYADDIVPHLPPSQDGFLNVLSSLPVIGANFANLSRFDYEPVGTLRFIDSSGGFDDDTPQLRLERTMSLVQLIVRGRFGQIVADHAIAWGSGYASAICPTGV